jgi:hypothetical protein
MTGSTARRVIREENYKLDLCALSLDTGFFNMLKNVSGCQNLTHDIDFPCLSQALSHHGSITRNA